MKNIGEFILFLDPNDFGVERVRNILYQSNKSSNGNLAETTFLSYVQNLLNFREFVSILMFRELIYDL